MLAFFYSLFASIARGQWLQFDYESTTRKLTTLINKTATMLVNALGGHFQTLQDFVIADASLTPTDIFSLVLAVVTTIMVALLTLKVVKQLFSIFFGGR